MAGAFEWDQRELHLRNRCNIHINQLTREQVMVPKYSWSSRITIDLSKLKYSSRRSFSIPTSCHLRTIVRSVDSFGTMVPNYGPGDSLQTETPFRVALVIVFGKPRDGLEFRCIPRCVSHGLDLGCLRKQPH